METISQKQSKSKIRKWVEQYKIDNSVCADCGISYPPYVLDFDHLRDKEFGISRAIQMGKSLDKIVKEIEKCEIVCSNCHRQRTHDRQMSS
jgi:protein-arginine kinase activator protein McsA